MSEDVDFKLRTQDVDFEKLCKFLAVKAELDEKKQPVGWQVGVEVEISVYRSKDPNYFHCSKYDKYNRWGIYIIIQCEFGYSHSAVMHMIGMTIAKYVVSEFKGDAFLTDSVYAFFYGVDGLFLTSNWLNKGYPFPRENTHHFVDLSAKYGRLHNISQVFNEPSDIVVHLLEDFITNEWCKCRSNDYHSEIHSLPKINQYVSHAFCVATYQLVIQKDAWNYGDHFDTQYPVTLHYRTSPEWRDVMIRHILGNCAGKDFHIDDIKSSIYDNKNIIVTTGDGDIIFLFKQGEFIINKNWQNYFSKFPLIVENYTIDDDLSANI